jgi:hypothetical protein
MGTYISHSLFIYDKAHKDIEEDKAKEIIADLRTKFEDAEFAIEHDGSTRSDTSWYTVDEDLKEFSKKYPDYLFCLYTETGMLDGYDKTYFINGKMQDCPGEVVYKDYDPALFTNH